VSVIVSLKEPPGVAGVGEMQTSTQTAQAAVLAEVNKSEFDVTTQYQVMPALAGRLTAGGAATLDCQPNVLSVGPNRPLYADLAQSVPFIHGDLVHPRRD
jgi:hypothetical protein